MPKSVLRIIRSMFFGLCVAVATATASQAQPQSKSEQYIVGAQDMIAWMQGANGVVLTAAGGFDSLLMVELMEVLSADVTDLNALETTLDAFKSKSLEARQDASRQLAELTPPERWDIGGWRSGSMERKIYSAADEFYRALPEMLEQIDDVSDSLIEIVEAVIEDDASFDVEAYSAQMSRVTRELLRSEIKIMTGMAAAIPKRSPNRWFHDIMIVSNKGLIAETDLLTIDYTSENALDERRKIGRQMQKALSEVPGLIEEGRETISVFDEDLSKMINTNSSQDEIALLNNVSKATQMFAQAFDIEQRMYELQMENAKLYASEEPDDIIDPIINENDGEFMMLMDERANQMISRMELVGG